MDIMKIHLPTVDSTNTWAKRQAESFSRGKMMVVTADEQTGGRGRFKRNWVSPSGKNIYASYCFFVEHYGKEIGNIPQIMALSVIHVLETLGFHPQLKWPNDVLLSKKKVGGILAETTSVEGGVCVVVGIGLNINMEREVLQTIDRPATSLFAETGKTFDLVTILDKLTAQFTHDITRYFAHGFAPFLEEYRKRIVKDIASPVKFHDNTKVWEGIFKAIESDGSITLLLPDNTAKTFLVGEILWE